MLHRGDRRRGCRADEHSGSESSSFLPFAEPADRWINDAVFLAYAQWQLDVDQGRLIVLEAIRHLEEHLEREPTAAAVTAAIGVMGGERQRVANTYLRALRSSKRRPERDETT